MCNREAPGVEQFARQHADQIHVIGLGTQDSLPDAERFRSKHGVASFPLLWESSFHSWDFFGVTAQPIAILLNRSGEPVATWQGAFDEAEVLARAATVTD